MNYIVSTIKCCNHNMTKFSMDVYIYLQALNITIADGALSTDTSILRDVVA